MSRRRNAVVGLAVVGAGIALGAALEEVLYRRVLGRPDPEAGEPIGTIAGEQLTVASFDGTILDAHAYGPSIAPLTIVFAHGVLESHVVWHYQVRDLADTHRLIAYDARGHAGSGSARGPHGDTPYNFSAQARDMACVIEEVTSGPVVIVGHSMGGMSAQALWAYGEIDRVRDRVVGLVLVNTSYTADLVGWRGGGRLSERTFERIEDVLQRIPFSTRMVSSVRPGRGDLTMLIGRLVYGKDPSPHHIAVSVRMYENTPSDMIAASIDLARFDAHDTLPHIDIPVLVVAGSRDLLTPSWLSGEIAAHVADAELVVFEDCGHIAPFERHDELTAHLRKFCERL